jgi:hypothetical protein
MDRTFDLAREHLIRTENTNLYKFQSIVLFFRLNQVFYAYSRSRL